MKTFFVCLLCIVLLGCKDNKRYTVTDSNGNTYTDLKRSNGGFGWTSFYTKEGKLIVFRGQFTYMEQ